MLTSYQALRRTAGLVTLAFVLAAGPQAAGAQESGGETATSGGTQSAATAETLAPPDASTPECAWIGQRVLGLLWRDDIDTANDFLTVYDRFGCPGGHVGPAFRCLVKVGVGAEEAGAGLPDRSKACWANPGLDPASLQPPVEGADGQQGEQQQNGEGQPAEQQQNQDQQQQQQ